MIFINAEYLARGYEKPQRFIRGEVSQVQLCIPGLLMAISTKSQELLWFFCCWRSQEMGISELAQRKWVPVCVNSSSGLTLKTFWKTQL